ncbi:MAG: hypothetical protein PWP69_1907 [Enterococcus sp.]|jgi:hypothetical protein|uniref:DUF6339 family protein n=1 Tax=Enterococcus sp. TaxID=35783 RepID=UPI0025863967|nr:DUF6339 family protein [Enterococcus sp.]MDK2845115.1 hypothetical protein [Enterococcus sp.]
MINWDNIHYDIGSATRDFNKLSIKPSFVEPIEPMDQFIGLRQDLIKARNDIFDEYSLDAANKLDYQFDLAFGIKIYKILNEQIGFTNRVANNDEVWRYLSIRVIPDIVHARWQLNEVHFFKTPRRIWLKTIWWYIHLSWKGNEEDTHSLLTKNTTDTIQQLVERPGIGYHVEMYREIMARYSDYEDSSRDLFRRVLKLNTARLLTTSPELVAGGIPAYVTNLFNSVGNK